MPSQPDVQGAATAERRRRERNARLLGVGAALAMMLAAGLAIGWPAPGVAAGLGFGVYLIARPHR